jgi:hypothetical protein
MGREMVVAMDREMASVTVDEGMELATVKVTELATVKGMVNKAGNPLNLQSFQNL